MAPSLVAQIRRIKRSREYASAPHRYLRSQLKPLVMAGLAKFAEYGKPIRPNQPWDLAHVRGDRSRYAGPAHQRCNRNTAGSAPERHSRLW